MNYLWRIGRIDGDCVRRPASLENTESGVVHTLFQLWDTTTGNLVTEFDSEDDAIEALCEVRSEEGDGPLLEFALFRFRDGRPTLIAKEHDLVRFVARARIQAVAPATGA